MVIVFALLVKEATAAPLPFTMSIPYLSKGANQKIQSTLILYEDKENDKVYVYVQEYGGSSIYYLEEPKVVWKRWSGLPLPIIPLNSLPVTKNERFIVPITAVIFLSSKAQK